MTVDEVAAAMAKDEPMPCPRHPVHARFYCHKCKALRCGICVERGLCVICRTIVRSTDAIYLASKETNLS